MSPIAVFTIFAAAGALLCLLFVRSMEHGARIKKLEERVGANAPGAAERVR